LPWRARITGLRYWWSHQRTRVGSSGYCTRWTHGSARTPTGAQGRSFRASHSMSSEFCEMAWPAYRYGATESLPTPLGTPDPIPLKEPLRQQSLGWGRAPRFGPGAPGRSLLMLGGENGIFRFTLALGFDRLCFRFLRLRRFLLLQFLRLLWLLWLL